MSASTGTTTLTGSTALVTGGSKGIGEGIAETLGRSGANVVVNYSKDQHAALAVVARIEAAGSHAVAIGADVAKEADVEALYAQAKEAFGTIDILVNNAGILQPGSLLDATTQSFHQQFGVNVLGLLVSSRAFARQADTGASIINISSNAPRLTPENLGIYTATKAAVDAFTRVHAKELGPRGIRVNAISPGLVASSATRSNGLLGSDMAAAIIEQTPLRRAGQPDDIADVATFLASRAARWVTGQVITVSGGI
ncbi:oxidoreductase [Mycolicibacterium madagascariense]|uniref:Oxidoreductase n=1 Tax=Mycolicibacterium madagascariense TaxID=212765 RepID=A0A7I7XJE0_9MYCO|nr:glucose 1-dehydrogenase [Mycolicibacterium madagascariense]MCV7015105.1 glucose 1-dehydrogenase [Mycolicibacterium madagascariense]BBZ29310.1 oxidoreductase [Mycolicibacterium madagascariense]